MINAETHLINNWSLFNRLVTYEAKLKPEYLVIDCETDGLVEKKVRLFGIGICFNAKKAFYIVWRDKNGNEVFTSEEQSKIKQWLVDTAAKTKVIGHNIVYDLMVLENTLSIDLSANVHADTVLMKHTVNEEQPHGLKDSSVQYLGDWANKAQNALKDNVIANGGRWVNDQKDMFMADTAILAEYCCWDVLLTFKLFEYFSPIIKEQELETLFYNDEIMPLYKEVTINMKRHGFPIDVAYFENLSKELTEIMASLEIEIQESIAEEVNGFVAEQLNEEFPIRESGNFPKAAAKILGIPLPVTKAGKVTLSQSALKKQLEATPQFADFYKWLVPDSRIVPKEVPVIRPVVTEDGREVLDSLGQPVVTKTIEIQNVTEYDHHPIPGIVLNNKYKIQKAMWDEKYPDEPYVFNLGSNDHLGYWFTKIKGMKTELTESGKPQINAAFLEEVKSDDEKVQKLLDLKKLAKINGTYVRGILDRQVDGRIYTSWLQFGTTSGRFSSRDPNLQNLPRIKEDDSGLSELVLKYVNAIKKGFVAPEGYTLVNADYSQLEPCCFAHMSGDEKLRDVFRKKLDLYSQVAIDVFKLQGVSANKKDPNFLKNLYPEKRQTSKGFCLAVPYGAEAPRIGQILNIQTKEAQELINNYLSSYPNLKKYMSTCNMSAKTKGMVRTEFGRIRHLPRAKQLYNMYGQNLIDWRWAKANNLGKERSELKNLLNNSKNFPIQGLAAHIVNRAMIAISREFIKQGIDGYIAAQVHDEITCIVRKDHADLAKKIVRECMEGTTKISVPLVAEPLIATNWAEAK